MGNTDVAVIGGGAAGLMAAGFAASRGLSVTVLEKMPRPARKLMITGKGRCNVTNSCDVDEFLSNVCQNSRFLYGAVSRFAPQDTIRFFEGLGVPLKTERGNRVFPVSDRAVDIVDALVAFVRQKGGRFWFEGAGEILKDEDRVCGVRLQCGEVLPCSNVILATGGLSYPGTGSTGDGYEMAKKLGHTVSDLRPSLVPIVASDGWCRKLQGLSLRNVTLRVMDTKTKKAVYEELGEMLFTHYGISGPLVLSASAHMKQEPLSRYQVQIDLKPGLDDKKLDLRLQRDFQKYSNRNFENSLGDLLAQKMIPEFVKMSGIPPEAKTNQITQKQRRILVALMKCLTLTPASFRPVAEAVVTSGGVSVKEVDPKTMQSKLLPGLYFAGEILDVDAYTGGFNLQIAFATGKLAGESVCG